MTYRLHVIFSDECILTKNTKPIFLTNTKIYLIRLTPQRCHNCCIMFSILKQLAT